MPIEPYESCEWCKGVSGPEFISHTNHMLHAILHNQEKTMAQLDQLNTLLASIQTTLADVATQASTIITDLQNAQNNTGVDLTGPIATATAIASALSSVDTQLTNAEVPPAPPAGS